MGSWAVEISSNRMYRDLFWLLCGLGRPRAGGRGSGRAQMPAWRSGQFAVCGGCRISVSVFTGYALLIWGGHDSAIRSWTGVRCSPDLPRAAWCMVWLYWLARLSQSQATQDEHQ
jgi:hypothetical protein